MDQAAFRQYQEESADWLRRGRADLVAHLIETHRPQRDSLELLEVGAGVGQNLPVLASFGTVDAAEINPSGQDAIRTLGITRTLFESPLPFELAAQYDVICALDVIEHVDDDRAVLRWVFEHLRTEGIFVATVPAYQVLFSDHDRALHHFRRYTKSGFCEQLPANAKVVATAYFNHLLFPLAVGARSAWSIKRMFASGRVAKQSSPKSPALASIFSGVLGAELTLIKNGYRPPWGLSVYCVARRT